MGSDVNFTRAKETHQELLRQFVTTELELAITFYELAVTARLGSQLNGAADAFHRNVENGQKAYKSAMHAMSRAQGDIGEEPSIANRMRKAESLFKKVQALKAER